MSFPESQRRRNSLTSVSTAASASSHLHLPQMRDLSTDSLMSMDDRFVKKARKPDAKLPPDQYHKSTTGTYYFPNGEVFRPRLTPTKRNRPQKTPPHSNSRTNSLNGSTHDIPRLNSMVSVLSASSAPFMTKSHSFNNLRAKSKSDLVQSLRNNRLDTPTNISVATFAGPGPQDHLQPLPQQQAPNKYYSSNIIRGSSAVSLPYDLEAYLTIPATGLSHQLLPGQTQKLTTNLSSDSQSNPSSLSNYNLNRLYSNTPQTSINNSESDDPHVSDATPDSSHNSHNDHADDRGAPVTVVTPKNVGGRNVAVIEPYSPSPVKLNPKSTPTPPIEDSIYTDDSLVESPTPMQSSSSASSIDQPSAATEKSLDNLSTLNEVSEENVDSVLLNNAAFQGRVPFTTGESSAGLKSPLEVFATPQGSPEYPEPNLGAVDVLDDLVAELKREVVKSEVAKSREIEPLLIAKKDAPTEENIAQTHEGQRDVLEKKENALNDETNVVDPSKKPMFIDTKAANGNAELEQKPRTPKTNYFDFHRNGAFNDFLNDKQAEVPPRGDLQVFENKIRKHERSASSISSFNSIAGNDKIKSAPETPMSKKSPISIGALSTNGSMVSPNKSSQLLSEIIDDALEQEEAEKSEIAKNDISSSTLEKPEIKDVPSVDPKLDSEAQGLVPAVEASDEKSPEGPIEIIAPIKLKPVKKKPPTYDLPTPKTSMLDVIGDDDLKLLPPTPPTPPSKRASYNPSVPLRLRPDANRVPHHLNKIPSINSGASIGSIARVPSGSPTKSLKSVSSSSVRDTKKPVPGNLKGLFKRMFQSSKGSVAASPITKTSQSMERPGSVPSSPTKPTKAIKGKSTANVFTPPVLRGSSSSDVNSSSSSIPSSSFKKKFSFSSFKTARSGPSNAPDALVQPQEVEPPIIADHENTEDLTLTKLPTIETEANIFDDILTSFDEKLNSVDVSKPSFINEPFLKDDELTRDQIEDQQMQDNVQLTDGSLESLPLDMEFIPRLTLSGHRASIRHSRHNSDELYVDENIRYLQSELIWPVDNESIDKLSVLTKIRSLEVEDVPTPDPLVGVSDQHVEDDSQTLIIDNEQLTNFFNNLTPQQRTRLPIHLKYIRQFKDFKTMEIKITRFDQFWMEYEQKNPVEPSMYTSILKKRSPVNTHTNSLSSNSSKSTAASAQQTKKVEFSNKISVNETFPPDMYRRYNKSVTQYTLTEPVQIHMIKNELNTYKCNEMLVHEKSQNNTHFFY